MDGIKYSLRFSQLTVQTQGTMSQTQAVNRMKNIVLIKICSMVKKYYIRFREKKKLSFAIIEIIFFKVRLSKKKLIYYASSTFLKKYPE